MINNVKLKTISDLNIEFNSGAEKFIATILIQLVKDKAIYNVIYNKPIKIENRIKYVDFSFMCSGVEIWLEYNGAQHYMVCGNTKDEAQLLQLQLRDKKVRQYARGAKIPFIVYGVEKNSAEYSNHFNNMNITYPHILKAAHKAVEGKFNYMFNNKKRN